MLAAVSRSWYASSNARETITPRRSMTNVPGCGMPAVLPVASLFRMPQAAIVFDPGSDSRGNVTPCLSVNAFSVSGLS
jgi:hypothetical protein